MEVRKMGREKRRKKPTSLGWIIIIIIFAVFILGIFLWIVPHIRVNPIGTIIRVIILLAIFAVVMVVVRELGGKRLFRK
jgi:polyferredoxin